MELNWQRKCPLIVNRHAYLLEKGYFSDCSFEVGKTGQIFQAHKLILVEASTVFETMFFGTIPERTDKPIKISDIEPHIFAILLKYLYTDEIDLKSYQDAVDLIYVAKKYMLDYLLQGCKDYIIKNLPPTNVLQIYKFGEFYEEPELLKAAIKVIRENTSTVLKLPEFLNIDISLMTAIIEQETLKVKEIELFQFLELLAKAQGLFETPEREQLNNGVVVKDFNKAQKWEKFRNAAKKIKYLSMTVNEFANGPIFSKLLLPEEAFAITACLSKPENVEKCYPFGFEKTKRQQTIIEDLTTSKLPQLTLRKGTNIMVMEFRSDILPKTVSAIQGLFASKTYGSTVSYFIFEHCARIRLSQSNFYFMETNNSMTSDIGTIAISDNFSLLIKLDNSAKFLPKSIVVGKVISGLFEVFNTTGKDELYFI